MQRMAQNSSVTAQPMRSRRGSRAGVVTPENLETIAKVAKKYHIPLVKITSGQRFLLVGVQEQDIADVRRELGNLGTASITPGVRYVQSCPGICTARTARRTRSPLPGISPMNMREKSSRKIKIGVSGRPRCCGESRYGISVSWERQRAGPYSLAGTAVLNLARVSRSRPASHQRRRGSYPDPA